MTPPRTPPKDDPSTPEDEQALWQAEYERITQAFYFANDALKAADPSDPNTDAFLRPKQEAAQAELVAFRIYWGEIGHAVGVAEPPVTITEHGVGQ